MARASKPASKPTCVLVLQGGGAMGAYQIGALQALQEQDFAPDWVCGISIGAINGAIIAGNPAEQRIARLEAFWDAISRPCAIPEFGSTSLKIWQHTLSFTEALTLGQPGFFKPRPLNPYLAPPGIAATSFYDTSPLYKTLAAAVDFKCLNDGKTRLSVGATDVEKGEIKFFDTRDKSKGPLAAEHVVASGSLPPGFPPTLIDGRFYWDGGAVSNSPLEAVQDDMPPGHTVAFVIDLWSASGKPPDTMSAVTWRAKQIQYASRIRHHVDAVGTKVNLRYAMHRLGYETKPPVERLDLVHIIYQPGPDQIPASDAEFSRGSIAVRRAAGLADMRRALAAHPWYDVAKSDQAGCCMIHCVTGSGVSTRAPN
jgi:NTE family protein